MRSRSDPDELSYLRNTDTISQCWRFPFPSTFSICKLPKKGAFFNVLSIEFHIYPWVLFSLLNVFVWPTKKNTITHDIWCISDEIWKVLKCTHWENITQVLMQFRQNSLHAATLRDTIFAESLQSRVNFSLQTCFTLLACSGEPFCRISLQSSAWHGH